MMKLKVAAAMLFAVASSIQAQVVIAAWDFTGENQLATSTADAYSTGLDSSAVLSRGSGAAASAGGNSFRTTGFQNNGIAVTNTDYFEFSLSATAGNMLSLSSINIRTNGTASFAVTPGVMQQFAYSLNGGTTFTLIDVPVITIGTGMTAAFDLSTTAALQNVPDTTTIILRYYASGQTATGGWGFSSNAAGDFGLSVSGTGVPMAVIPEPATYMLFGMGLLVCAQQFRRRRAAANK